MALPLFYVYYLECKFLRRGILFFQMGSLQYFIKCLWLELLFLYIFNSSLTSFKFLTLWEKAIFSEIPRISSISSRYHPWIKYEIALIHSN